MRGSYLFDDFRMFKRFLTPIHNFKMMPLEDPSSMMRQAQYQVCLDFIDKLEEGCTSVTAIIGKYPALVEVGVRETTSLFK